MMLFQQSHMGGFENEPTLLFQRDKEKIVLLIINKSAYIKRQKDKLVTVCLRM